MGASRCSTLRELIGDAVTGMSQVFEEQAIKVDVELPQKVPPGGAPTSTRIIQVMLNLLSKRPPSSASPAAAASASRSRHSPGRLRVGKWRGQTGPASIRPISG